MNIKTERAQAITRRHFLKASQAGVGAAALSSLLGKPLPQARGHVHKVEGVRAVVTFHPRQLINQPSSKSLAWKDLLLLMEDES